MRAPRAFHRLTVNDFWAGPALRCAEHNHRPTRSLGVARHSCVVLNFMNAQQSRVECRGKYLMHQRWIVTFDKMRLITVATHQVGQLVAADACEHRWVRDLEPVEMQDRKHRTIPRWIKKFVGMPAGCQRRCFCLAIAHDAGNNQVRIIERRAIRMRQRITELAALVNRARCLGCHVTRNAGRPRELAKQTPQPVAVLRNLGIALGVCALKIGMRHDARPAMTRADHHHHVQVVGFDQTIQMYVEKVKPWCGAPMPK